VQNKMSTSNVFVKFLAVGRLAKNSDGSFNENDHQIIALLAQDKNDPSYKSYKTHVKQIMSKGAPKLKPNKRIRLTSDGNEYELHVMADLLENKEDQIIVFFAVTDVDFSKTHSVAKLLEDFKTSFYAINGPESIKQAKANGIVHKDSQQTLETLFKKYGTNKIAEVQEKVEQVKSLMRDNVDKTLENVEKLEDLEEKSANIENSAKIFEKNASNVKSVMRWKYIKMTLLIIGIVLLIFLVIFIPIIIKYK